MSDRITLRGVTARGYHGVLESERQLGQPFCVDVVLEVDLREAGQSDELEATVSYADVAVDVVRVVQGPPADLVETLAERIASDALRRQRVEAVEVSVHKPHAPVGVPFDDVAVTVRRERDVPVVIALGANIGEQDRLVGTLTSAVAELAATDGLRLRRLSRLVRSAPVGGPPQPDYLNSVLVARTRLAPTTLLRVLHDIEEQHGRQRPGGAGDQGRPGGAGDQGRPGGVGDQARDVRWGPRTLDLDLVQYGEPGTAGEVRASGPGLELPHPRAHQRAFVLVPWLEADPRARLRVGDGVRDVKALVAGLTRDGSPDASPDQAHAIPDAASLGIAPGPAWAALHPLTGLLGGAS